MTEQDRRIRASAVSVLACAHYRHHAAILQPAGAPLAPQARCLCYSRFSPVRREKASRYFALVFSTIARGRWGAGGVLSQSSVSRLSRTNCLSKLGGLVPTRYSSAGQKREESGVRHSSISSSSSPNFPNSNLVSAIMIPRAAAYSLPA